MKEHSDDGEGIPLTLHGRPRSPHKPARSSHQQRRQTWVLAAAGCTLVASIIVLAVVLNMEHNPQPGIDPHILEALPDPPDSCTPSLRAKVAWGVGTSAYQIEGAPSDGGKGLSIWDTFSHTPGKVAANETGDVAVDHYHRFKQDVALMQRLGIRYYKLSLSWPRILPAGGRGVLPNRPGLSYYKSLLRALSQAGITPVVTLYHWDLPQELQDLYQGFLDPQVAADFTNYADIAFREFGPYVKHWLTFNEPMSICQLGYGIGVHAPGHEGAAKAQYRCGHHLLLAHAKTVQLYRQKYQAEQGGRISMALSGHWGRPFNATSKADMAAAKAYVEFQVAWLADPLYYGDYPKLMKNTQKQLLPGFLESEKKLLAGSMDFFALNFYTTHFVREAPDGAPAAQVYEEVLSNATGASPGGPSELFWLYDTPSGLRDMLKWVSERYKRPEVWVTENGFAVKGEAAVPLKEALQDTRRIQFFTGYLDALCTSVSKDQTNLAAYFAWSLMDNFEWADGYAPRFGLVAVDYKDKLKRYPKLSAYWMSEHFFKRSPSQIACLEIRSCTAAAAGGK